MRVITDRDEYKTVKHFNEEIAPNQGRSPINFRLAGPALEVKEFLESLKESNEAGADKSDIS